MKFFEEKDKIEERIEEKEDLDLKLAKSNLKAKETQQEIAEEQLGMASWNKWSLIGNAVFAIINLSLLAYQVFFMK